MGSSETELKLTSGGDIGLSYRPVGQTISETRSWAPAGLNRSQAAYFEHAHVFPRFDRQKIRAYQNPAIMTGELQADPRLVSAVRI